MARKKRRSSWGSITSYGRNKHVLRYMANTPEGRTRKSVTLNCTYMEAALERDRLHVLNADKGDKPVPTIGKAYSMWYEPWLRRRLREGKIKQRTYVSYTECWYRHVKPRWDNTPADSTAPSDIQDWLTTLAPTSAKLAIVVAGKIVDFVVKYEIAESNKFRLGYEMPTERVRMKRTGTYSLAEAESALESLRGTTVEAPFILAEFGSARVGESLGVRPEEVSVVEAHGLKLAVVPAIRRMDLKGDTPLPDGDLKNRQSVRPLIIPEPYGLQIADIAEQRIRSGSEWMADRGDGTPHNIGTLNYAWSRDAENPIPFANLRTSWRTIAQYEWRIDHDTLEILMGHLLQGVTGKHYLKPTTENLIDAVARAVVQSRAT